MGIIMTLWIGNGAVLKSSSQWQLKEFRKCKQLQAISPFPTMLSKDFYCRQVENQGLFGKGLKRE